MVQGFFEKGEDAAGACKGLMELANRRWSDMVGDYRDDITATVVRLPFLPPTAAAEALAVHVTTTQEAGDAAAARAASSTEKEAAAVAADKNSVAGHPSGEPARCPDAAQKGAPTSSGDGLDSQKPGASTAVPGGGSREEGEEAGRVEAVALAMAAATRGLEGPDTTREEGETSTSTPAITPEDVSEEEDDGGGGGGGGLTKESKTTRRPLSTIPEALAAKKEKGNAGKGGAEDGADRPLSPAPAFLPMPPPPAAASSAVAAAAAEAPATDQTDRASRLRTSVMCDANVMGADGAEGEEEDDTGEEGGEEEEEGEEWEWEFGARENREPSREIREASREFPSGSLDALVGGVDKKNPLLPGGI